MSVGTGGAHSALRARDARGTSAPLHDDTAEAAPGLGIDPDDLPDGIVVADEHGRVVCFNAAAARITAVPAAEALGRRLEAALPLEDLEGRRWWQVTDPYGGLAIRNGQPERNLLLPGGREILVSARYVRTHPSDRSAGSSSACATPRPAAAPSAATPS